MDKEGILTLAEARALDYDVKRDKTEKGWHIETCWAPMPPITRGYATRRKALYVLTQLLLHKHTTDELRAMIEKKQRGE